MLAQCCNVIDTGAERYFVDLKILPVKVREKIERTETPTILDSSQNRLNVLGSIHSCVYLSSLVTLEKFIVCNYLAAHYILDRTYMSHNFKAILQAERSIQMTNGSYAKLFSQSQSVAQKISVDESKLSDLDQRELALIQLQISSSAIRVCKQVIVQSIYQVWLL